MAEPATITKMVEPATKNAAPSFIGMTEFDGKINKNLLAYIAMDLASGHNDNQPTKDSTVVVALMEDAEFSLDNQYSTPFENSNPEGRMPNLMGMIQSGQITSSMHGIMEALGVPQSIQNAVDGSGAAQQLEGLKGKTSFTKVNSQQIYTSSNSIKISGTLIFSAWANAKTEVEDAIQKLQEWATPAVLSDQSAVINAIDQASPAGLFSSIVPPTICLNYGGKKYSPLVIENLSAPLSAPMNEDGNRITVKCQVTFLSLKAWDKNNILSLYGGTPITVNT